MTPMTTPDNQPAQARTEEMTLRIKAAIRPDGRVDVDSLFVDITAVAHAAGFLGSAVLLKGPALGFKIVTDAAGDKGFTLTDGVRLVHELRAGEEEHSARWRRYVAYREEQEAAAERKRRDEAAAEKEQNRVTAALHWMRQKTSKDKADEAAAAKAAKERAKRDNITDFADWSG